MNKTSLQRRAALAMALAGALPCTGSAMAQEAWPTKPITLVVAYPPGGGTDIMARLVSSKMSAILGQSVVILNKPGSAGQIGAAYVAHGAPDGYTVLVDAASFAINLGLYAKLPYDAKSFTPVAMMATFPLVVVAAPNFEARSMGDVVAMAKAKPGAVFYASSGNGSIQNLFGAAFMQQSGIQLTHVPYKGAGPAMNDVMGGQVPLFFANAAAALPFIQGGRMRALAVTGTHRLSSLPNVPTLAEAGVADVRMAEWSGVYVPAGTPPAVVARLGEAVRQALADPEIRGRIAELSGDVYTGSQAEAAAWIDGEIARMARIIKDTGVKGD